VYSISFYSFFSFVLFRKKVRHFTYQWIFYYQTLLWVRLVAGKHSYHKNINFGHWIQISSTYSSIESFLLYRSLGTDTDHVESCNFTTSNCLIYLKSGHMVRKSGKIVKNFNKIGENRNFRIVSIDTASAPDLTTNIFTLDRKNNPIIWSNGRKEMGNVFLYRLYPSIGYWSNWK